jgi:D-3-phosphoglycerate dehydrogenase / 2-oxoglutarate reductase
MPHVLVAGKIHDAGIAVLKAAPGFTLDVVDEISTESYLPFMPRAEAILIRTQPMPASAIAMAPGLRIVSRHGVGYDAVDVAALNARRIPLAIVGDVNSRAVAEHTLMLMLAAARRTVAYDQAARAGNWNMRNSFDAVELDGKRLLVFGFGRIGRRVAELARAFGMAVTVVDPNVTPGAMRDAGVEPAESLRDALPHADYVSLHVPMIGGKAVLGPAELALLKRSAIVVNAARGGLIDEPALDAALRARKLRAAAIDVLAEEPPKPGHPLLTNPFITISPHNAGLTEECAARMGVAAARNIVDFFAGKLDARLVVNASDLGD